MMTSESDLLDICPGRAASLVPDGRSHLGAKASLSANGRRDLT